jgi:hypothetical protein
MCDQLSRFIITLNRAKSAGATRRRRSMVATADATADVSAVVQLDKDFADVW